MYLPDLTRYTILQSLKAIPAAPFDRSSTAAEASRASATVFIAYRFGYPEPAETSYTTVASPVYPYPTSMSTHHQVRPPSKPSAEPLSLYYFLHSLYRWVPTILNGEHHWRM